MYKTHKKYKNAPKGNLIHVVMTNRGTSSQKLDSSRCDNMSHYFLLLFSIQFKFNFFIPKGDNYENLESFICYHCDNLYIGCLQPRNILR